MLKEKIINKEAKIGVLGLGYVGLPLAVEKAKAGYNVVGFDVQKEKVDKVNRGENYIGDVVNEDLEEIVKNKHLEASTDFDRLKDCDVISICVPTPLDKFKQPDLQFVEASTREVAKRLRKDTLVVLESTTYPGTTEDVMKPILEASGLVCGEDFYLAFSPERVDPGNLLYKTKNTPKVVGGVGEVSADVAKTMYEAVLDAEVFVVSSPKEAEMSKILENTFRIVNIGLINEMSIVANKMDINLWEVIDAAATKPFGFMPFYPGPGLGGHCIPIDPHYLSWLARKHDFETSFITLSARINEGMPFYVVESVVEAIARQPVQLSEASVLVLGVAFKRNVDDTRHSPAGTIIKLLREKDIDNIHYHDPHVDSFSVPTAENEVLDIPAVEELSPEVLQQYDATVIVTDHDAFDPHQVAEHATSIVDTRNALEEVTDPALREKILLLGGGEE